MQRQETKRSLCGAYLAGWFVLLCGVVESLTLAVPDGETNCVIIHAEESKYIYGNFEVLTPARTFKNIMITLRHIDTNELYYKDKGKAEYYFSTIARVGGDYELCFVNGDEGALEKADRKKMVGDEGYDELLKRRKKILEENRQEAEKDAGKGSADQPKPDLTDKDDDDGILKAQYDGEESEESLNALLSSDSWYSEQFNHKTFGFSVRIGQAGHDPKAYAKMTKEEQKVTRMADFMTDEATLLMQNLADFTSHTSNMRSKEHLHSAEMGKTSTSLLYATLIEAAVLIWVSWTQLSYIRRFFETKRVL